MPTFNQLVKQGRKKGYLQVQFPRYAEGPEYAEEQGD